VNVRPKYTVWDPYTQTDINKVEAVQRRAARNVANNHRNRSSVSNIALLVIELMCWSHCNLFVNVRPKYLADVTDSSVCPCIIQRLKWKPLADRRKDARLEMLYKIDRELVATNKENRLIPPGRKKQTSTQQVIPDTILPH
jgi:hypothetical protein